MIGLDTNVVVRLFIDDGSREVDLARHFVADAASRGERFRIDRVVLAETTWVLKTAFDCQRGDIVALVEGLLSNGAYEVEDREIVRAACDKFGEGLADFSDCLVAACNAAAGCGVTATFDRAMRKLPAVRVLGVTAQ